MHELSFYRKRKNISQEELGKKLGVQKTNISAWENGSRKIPIKHLDALASALNLTASELNDITNNQNESVMQLKLKQSGCYVPLVSMAAAAMCNPGLMPMMDCVSDRAEEKVFFPGAKETDFAIRVSGESMTPWYPEGTLLLVRQIPISEIANGKRVVAVLDNGDIVFKIYARKNNKIALYSISDEGKDMVFDHGIGLRYICKVLSSIRNEDELDDAMAGAGLHHGWMDKYKKL